MNHRLNRMLTAILDEAANPYVAIFALRLLMSPKKVRDEWYRVGYRLPWQKGPEETL